MTAIIPINDKYRIELDKHAWQVSKWQNRPSRNIGGSWEGCEWYNTLQKAGESVQRRLVAEEDLEGVQEVIDTLTRSSQLIAMAKSEFQDFWLDQANG